MFSERRSESVLTESSDLLRIEIEKKVHSLEKKLKSLSLFSGIEKS